MIQGLQVSFVSLMVVAVPAPVMVEADDGQFFKPGFYFITERSGNIIFGCVFFDEVCHSFLDWLFSADEVNERHSEFQPV
jgi:hypothetical protein